MARLSPVCLICCECICGEGGRTHTLCACLSAEISDQQHPPHTCTQIHTYSPLISLLSCLSLAICCFADMHDLSFTRDSPSGYYSRFLDSMQDLRVPLGSDVEVNCSTTASETPEYFWQKEVRALLTIALAVATFAHSSLAYRREDTFSCDAQQRKGRETSPTGFVFLRKTATRDGALRQSLDKTHFERVSIHPSM